MIKLTKLASSNAIGVLALSSLVGAAFLMGGANPAYPLPVRSTGRRGAGRRMDPLAFAARHAGSRVAQRSASY